MAELDQGIKRLIQLRPKDWLAFLFGALATYLGTAPTDVATEPQLILDTLLHILYEGEECLVDIELEAHPKTDIGQRLYEYAARASAIYKLKVISVVFWLTPHGQPPVSPYEIRVGSRRLGTWEYTGIEVYRLHASDLIHLGRQGLVGLLPLVPFTQDGGAVEVVEMTGQVIKELAPADQLDTLATLLGVFAARSIGQELAQTLVRRLFMSNEILELSPLYRKWVSEGREEGREEGVAAGLREAIIATLRGRFGALPPEVEQALASADRAALEALLPSIATEALEQVRALLGV